MLAEEFFMACGLCLSYLFNSWDSLELLLLSLWHPREHDVYILHSQDDKIKVIYWDSK